MAMNTSEEPGPKRMKASLKRQVRAVVVQLNPGHKDVAGAIRKAKALTSRLSREDEIDVVLFPEMAFSGYVFKSPEDVAEVAERIDDRTSIGSSGITLGFLKELAVQLDSAVVASLPEIAVDEDSSNKTFHVAQVSVDHDGRIAHVYRKHALFGPDKDWATPGECLGGVVKLRVKHKTFYFSSSTEDSDTKEKFATIRCGLGICLDMLQYWEEKEKARKSRQDEFLADAPAWCSGRERANAVSPLEEVFKKQDIDVILFSTAEPMWDLVDFFDYFGLRGEEELRGRTSLDPAWLDGKISSELLRALHDDGAASKEVREELLGFIQDRDFIEPMERLLEDKGGVDKSVLFLVSARCGWEPAAAKAAGGEGAAGLQFSGGSCAYDIRSPSSSGGGASKSWKRLSGLGIHDEEVLVVEAEV